MQISQSALAPTNDVRRPGFTFSEEVAFHRLAVQNFPLCSIFYLKFVLFLVIPIFACYTSHCVATRFTHYKTEMKIIHFTCLTTFCFSIYFSQPITRTQLSSASIVLKMSSWTFKKKIFTWGPAGYYSYRSIIWVQQQQ